MLSARVIPCLLLKNQGLVKTKKFKNPVYVGDPINAVKIFNEKEVDELLIIDIDATINKKSPQFDLLERIGKEAFMPMSYGGGIHSIEDAKKILSIGFEKISINSSAIEKPNLIKEIADIYGTQSVIASIDVKKNIMGHYEVYDYKKGRTIKKDPFKFALELQNFGAGEILLNSVDRDGTMSGYDISTINKITELVSIPVIAMGGAGSLEDIQKVIKIGNASAAAAGSLFVFQGVHRAVLITYPEREEIEKLIR